MRNNTTEEGTACPATLLRLLYGTAWKSENTKQLVCEAVRAGLRAFDTAAQPKHYREDLLEAAIRSVIETDAIPQGELWLQTKFTPSTCQDPKNIPYDPTTPLQVQVITSVANSLKNLNHDPSPADPTSHAYLDCLILHAPLRNPESTLEVWDYISSLVPHPVRHLGISNVSLPMLELLYEHMRVKPSIVQNAFHGGRGYDVELRAFCKDKGITYQGFWVLKKNASLLQSLPVKACADAADVSTEASLYGRSSMETRTPKECLRVWKV